MAKLGRPRIYPPICLVPECNRKHRARGFCDKHYAQWRYDHPEAEVIKQSRWGATIEEIVDNNTEIVNDEHGEHWIWKRSYRSKTGNIPQVSSRQFDGELNVRVVLWESLNEQKVPNRRKNTVRSRSTCPRGCVNPDHLSVQTYTGKDVVNV